MLAAALHDGTAHRRTTFEVFARRLPEGRRYGVVAGTARFVEALPQFRFDDDALAIARGLPRPDNAARTSPTTGSAVTSTATPKGELYFPGSPVLSVHGTFAECVVLETLALSIFNHDTAIASAAARMVSAADGAPADRDGLPTHPRAGRRRRGARRLHRRVHRHRRTSRRSAATACPRWAPAHTRSRCCTPPTTVPTSGPRSGAGRRARRRHHTARRHLRHHAGGGQRRRGGRPRTRARSASTPATSACWPARSAPNSTASAQPRHASWCRVTSTSSRSPRCAPNPSTSTASARRWSPARAPRPRAWSTSWSRWTACRSRNAAATRNPTAAASRRSGLAKQSGTIVEEVVHPFGRPPPDQPGRALTVAAGARGRTVGRPQHRRGPAGA